jgi:uncharacterized protein YxeA
MKKVLPIVLFAVITVLIGSVLFEKCNNNVEHKAFLAQVDSLHKVNDSLQAEIAKDDAAIDSLDIVAVELQYKVDHQKAKVKTIVKYIEIESPDSNRDFLFNNKRIINCLLSINGPPWCDIRFAHHHLLQSFLTISPHRQLVLP